MSLKIYTPTMLNTEIKSILSIDFLKNISLEGEISNWKLSSTGHVYFNLKDEKSIISCIIWSSLFEKISLEEKKSLKEGAQIIIEGDLDFYIPGSKCNFIIKKLSLKGKGNLWLQFEQLKKELEKQGLFDLKHKKPIKQINLNIAVITSETGAVIEDIRQTIQNRFPLATIYLYPTVVQGVNAKDSIIKSLKKADKNSHDVIILARGGGSIEDLWSFNEKDVAFAIFDLKTPIISAVGHETDYTISDFVADVRAETPTGAAMRVVPDWRDLVNTIENKSKNLFKQIESILNFKKLKLLNLTESFNPILNNFINKFQKQFLSFENRLNNFILKKIEQNRSIIERMNTRLIDLNPENILKRGYSITTFNGKVLTSIGKLKEKDIIETVLSDGKVKSIISK